MNEGMTAMGSDTRQGIDMAVSIINGLISGDMKGAAAGALAPKIATIIKQQTEGNTVANTVSHAILGAVVAELQGNSALVGGLGAAASERGAEVIAGILYPGKDIKNLSQEERQKISALSQLATGLAIAASGGDIQDVNTGVAAGKNAVENNAIIGQFVGKTDEEIKKMLHAQSNCENDRKGCELVGIIVIGTILAPVAIILLPEEAIIGGLLSGTASIGGQYYFNEDSSINWRDVGIASGVGAVTGGVGTGFWGTISWNAAGGALSNQLDGKDPVKGAIIGAGSSTIGYGVGKYAEKGLRPIFNPAANKYIHETNKGFLGITGHYTESSIPAIGGNVADSILGTMTENIIKEGFKDKKSEKK